MLLTNERIACAPSGGKRGEVSVGRSKIEAFFA